ncbi:aspartic peptidase domain-containing protein [Vararia minispora EC-137]|uniref:Aspartic peptidase domain-containing protein n=1 Tax=Vararia minispora EC-137 TaxID=1314806 RepID=A0ACB8QLT0_9AGAM|nr:aspartic peptidase domain-containing protein [Vararia minispora EC-137]
MYWVLSLLPALVAAAPSPQPASNVHHVPLIRRAPFRTASGFIDMDRLVAAKDSLRLKYGFVTPDQVQRRATQTDITVGNQGGDVSYFAQVSVGTPSQTFNVVLDTGSSDLWFASSQCRTCPSGTPLLQLTSSSLQTSSNAVTLSYGSGSASGTLAQDTVSMGPYTVSNQIFVAVSDMTSGLVDGKLAGIMGLAFDSLAASGATPFWETLVQGNQLSSPEFGFFLTRFLDTATSTQETDPGGVFTLGGSNSTFFTGNIEFINLPGSTQSFWLQQVSSLSLNGNSVALGSSNLAAIDTGTTLLGGPTTAVQNFWQQVNGAQALTGQSQGFWAFPCQTNLSASLSFGGKSWPINPADMNLGEIARGFCMGALFDVTQGASIGSGTPSWIVGDTFLKNVYTVFRANPAAVGFAELSNAAGGSSGTSPVPLHAALLHPPSVWAPRGG